MGDFTTGERGQPILRPTGPPRNHSDDTFAVDTPRAADLPDGTVVANGPKVWMKDDPDYRVQWHDLNGATWYNDELDDALAAGARVLRYGYSEDSDEGDGFTHEDIARDMGGRWDE